MIKLALAATILALSAAPSFASFGLMCDGPDGIDVNVALGGGVGISVLGAEITAPGGVWSTDPTKAGATPIVAAQGASVDNRWYLDFSDPNAEAILVEIRLFWAEEETDPVYGGTLRIAGAGAWPISCGMG
jgi:hypothetical protein